MNKKEHALKHIAKQLNEANITWGLGASMLLHYLGYDVTVSDIDILIDEKDIEKFKPIIEQYQYEKKTSTVKYKTEYFYTCHIMDVEFDFMLGFRVQTNEGLYDFNFSKQKIMRTIKLDKIDIPLCSEKEWYKAYKAIGRDDKVKLMNKKNQF